ncbi:ATP-binding cassette domain-containing protein [Microbacterium amylolyticum]|uniref:Energy-coupling factor transport system ATP-binding protein n=1 Tax=Microbacterium amylolyticum TaxID=936337 RepID=A0ABS4ZGL1_9MICO|nr:ATP-binding cassette domain-containing protein [Microbacterium amylolyticum]MBP2436415.1 energy-coupling factor transport system ATP-binding protein [Microbacterium amylolyticum]
MTTRDTATSVSGDGRSARGTDALVALDSVTITHPDGDRAAVNDVSMSVGPGEVVLLVGPSGAGKSTLTLALGGLIPHSADADLSGDVRLGGFSTRDARPGELSTRVGMVFQDPDAQVVTASVFAEVAFGLENLRIAPEDVERRTEHALRRMGLWERRDDDPDALSGGGRQRLAIACAIALDPPLLVLDEPTANLDPKGVTDVYRALRDVVASGEHAIVLVEHNVETALEIATRVVVLGSDGSLAFDGTPAEVIEGHADDLTALGVWLPGDASRERRAPAAEQNGPAITARGLTVTRGRGRRRRTVLENVDVTIARGSITAIVGENGTGKTTLAQALAGVIDPVSGTIDVLGANPARTRPRALAGRVGFVFQNPEHQFVTHTVRDELAHDLRRRRVPAAEIDARVDEMLDRLGLAGDADRHPFRLSGGQKRRLSVGAVLIGMSPGGVLVLDEPLYGQDRARADELIDMLLDLHAHGTTIVIVTHDRDLVQRIATDVINVGADVPSMPRQHNAAPAPPAVLRPLERLNPLAKLGAVLPAMIALVFARDVLTPALLLAASAVILLIGARWDRRLFAWLGFALPAIITVLTVGFALWTDPYTGIATGLRLAALLALALIPGLTGDGADLVRALVQQLRMPYRIGYAALAALRFVPRFRHELDIIRLAQRVRGRAPHLATALVPLLAGGIRHAERVALAMDARAFGAYDTRTERHPVIWRRSDTWFTVIGVAITAAIFAAGVVF